MICIKEDLQELYLSVIQNCGKQLDKLYESIKNSTYKIFAYDDNKLIGLATGLSDNCINLFISYLVVRPKYQDKKIGTMLLKKIISKKDFNRIQLVT